MKVVVVGAKGTLGARLMRELACEGVDFRARDRDARDAAWRSVVAGADVVVNAGGPRVRAGLGKDDYAREHVGVTEATIGAMRHGAHLVHLSSTAVFGARRALLYADTPEAPERFPMPDYAAAKLAAERVAITAAKRAGVDITVLRPSMVYGPAVDSALESVRSLARRGVSLRFLPGRVRQHLTHVDLLVASLRAAFPKARGPKPLLVADPFVLTNADLVIPRGAPVFVPLPPFVRGSRLLRRLGVAQLHVDSLAVLGIDNVFEVDGTFKTLSLPREQFDRDHTFDRYFAMSP